MKKGRKVNIRCRKCWQDVKQQREFEAVEPCPLCGKPETYIHSLVPAPYNPDYYVKKLEKKDQEADDGSADPG